MQDIKELDTVKKSNLLLLLDELDSIYDRFMAHPQARETLKKLQESGNDESI